MHRPIAPNLVNNLAKVQSTMKASDIGYLLVCTTILGAIINGFATGILFLPFVLVGWALYRAGQVTANTTTNVVRKLDNARTDKYAEHIAEAIRRGRKEASL